jgi:hypothetical protein
VSNGGAVDSKRRPIGPSAQDAQKIVIIDDDEIDLDEELTAQAAKRGEHRPKRYIKGLCEDPRDCSNCKFLRAELVHHPRDQVTWVCPTCLPVLYKDTKTRGVVVDSPGHFTEGYCQYYACDRPAMPEMLDGLPGIDTDQMTERPGRYSRFLQLILGKVNP